jgi:16S rRNA (uracil1498-N3)-methyltransferase
MGLLCSEERWRPPVTLPRIYLPRLLETGDICAATEEQTRYLKIVLRMDTGDPLVVFNGTSWEYDAVIRRASPEGIDLEVTGKRPVPVSELEITLCQAIPKAEKMDAIIRCATELGVGRIIPFFAERSVPRWPAVKSPQKQARWQKIAVEACRQCGRTDIPEIGGIATFTEMLCSGRLDGLHLIFWEEESAKGIREVLRDPDYGAVKSYFLVIGPEGGFEKNEIDRARQAGFLSVSLGKRVLRVDTATLAVLAVLQYEKGALGGMDR